MFKIKIYIKMQITYYMYFNYIVFIFIKNKYT